MKYIAALFCMVLAFGNAAAAPRDMYRVQQVVDDMSYPGVHVTWSWEKCWQINAFYQPSTKHVTMCEELKEVMTPGQIRFTMAHEMGHAVIHQLGIPYTGLQETAADEIAAYVFTTTHRVEEVKEIAAFWYGLGRAEDPLDPHPGDMRRAYTLMCLAIGAADQDYANPECVEQWRYTVRAWNYLLKVEE